MSATPEAMQALVGRPFPGGTVTIEHWENALLTDATGSTPLPDGLVHPVWLFHGAIAAVGSSLRELFALFQAESDEAIRAGGYEWTMPVPLREGHVYRASGEVIGVERKTSRSLGPMDVTSFRIDLHDGTGRLVASTVSTWLVLRSAG
jgi:acyl dehydratase